VKSGSRLGWSCSRPKSSTCGKATSSPVGGKGCPGSRSRLHRQRWQPHRTTDLTHNRPAGATPAGIVVTSTRSRRTTTFGIFDVFPRESGRDAHLAGRLAAALTNRAPELLAQDPSIEKVEALGSKLP
jgi:hypothetical protein